MKLVVKMNTVDLNKLQYQVVVEMWRHKSSGRGKRLYFAEFTEAERVRIGRLHTMFEKWHGTNGVIFGEYEDEDGNLCTGTPQAFYFSSMAEIDFISRVVRFFGTL
jgi:hypothetical protein